MSVLHWHLHTLADSLFRCWCGPVQEFFKVGIAVSIGIGGTVGGIARVKSVQVLPGIRIGLDTPEPGSRALCWRFGLDALMRDVASMHLGSHSRLPTVDSSPPSLYALVFFNQTLPASRSLLRGDRGMPVAQRLCRPDRECRSTVG